MTIFADPETKLGWNSLGDQSLHWARRQSWSLLISVNCPPPQRNKAKLDRDFAARLGLIQSRRFTTKGVVFLPVLSFWLTAVNYSFSSWGTCSCHTCQRYALLCCVSLSLETHKFSWFFLIGKLHTSALSCSLEPNLNRPKAWTETQPQSFHFVHRLFINYEQFRLKTHG